MMALSLASTLRFAPPISGSSTQISSLSSQFGVNSFWFSRSLPSGTQYKQPFPIPSVNKKSTTLPLSSPKRLIIRAAEYKFPDPITEFADAEREKFRDHLLKRLTKKDICGESVEEVVELCTDIFSTFLHSEYGGPGTLLVIPFIDMADAVNQRGLPGGPQAARVAVKWAEKHVDKDWKQWNNDDSK